MSVTSDYTPTREAGNGSKVDFDANFPVIQATDLKVGKILNSTNVKTDLTYGVDYTVTINASTKTPTVHYVVAPTALEDSWIGRNVPNTQTAVIPTNNIFREVQVNNALDKHTMIDQQLEEKIGRCLQLSEISSLTNLTVPEPVAGKTLKWTTSLTGLENSTYDPDEVVPLAQGYAEDASDSAAEATIQAGLAETARLAAVAAQGAAVTAQGLAEDARDLANTYKGDAQTAKTAAETAQGLAEDARDLANTYKGDAQTAKTAAEDARDLAQTYAEALQATSTTSLAIGTGSKTFTTQAGKQFAAGMFFLAVDTADNANWMFGQVTSYTTTSLVLDCQVVGGSGTKSSWNLYLAGSRGAIGATGATGAKGDTGNAGADGKTWYSGTTVPSDALGVDGDYYFCTSTGDVYKKAAGTWDSPVVNLTGPQGPAGSGTGDVLGPAANTADYIPQWDGANSKKLKDGLAVPAGGLAGLTALGTKITANAPITGATKTKITYDANGLVTGGADATTADIADSSDKRYCTDAQKVVIGNTSGTNTGDQTLVGLGGVSVAEAEVIRDNIALLAFRQQTNDAVTIQKMQDGVVDEYEDESGINTGSSSGQVYDSSNDLYAPGPDGIDSYVKAMLHGDGTQGSTTITDSETTPKTWTVNGSPIISTAQKKFGSGSILFDGSNSGYISTPDHADWALSNGVFTIDFWVRFTSTPASSHNQWLFYQGDGNNIYQHCYVNTIGKLGFGVKNTTWVFQMTCDFSPTVDTWYHIEIARVNTDNAATGWRIFIDGVAQTLTLDAGAWNATLTDIGYSMYLGNMYNNSSCGLLGYLEEFRWSKGVTRHSSAFTPRTSAYSASANMSLLSAAFTALSQPSKARIVVFEEDVDALTLNTDIIASVSRDGGTTFTAAVLANAGLFDTSKNILAATIDLSSQPAGTSVKYKIESANNKNFKVHGTGVLWR